MRQHPAEETSSTAVLSARLVKLPVGWPWHICDPTFCSVFAHLYVTGIEKLDQGTTMIAAELGVFTAWGVNFHQLPRSVDFMVISNGRQDTDDGSNRLVSTTTHHLKWWGYADRPGRGEIETLQKMASKERCLLGLCPYLFQSPAPFSMVFVEPRKQGKAMVMLPMLPCSTRGKRERWKKNLRKSRCIRPFRNLWSPFRPLLCPDSLGSDINGPFTLRLLILT